MLEHKAGELLTASGGACNSDSKLSPNHQERCVQVLDTFMDLRSSPDRTRCNRQLWEEVLRPDVVMHYPVTSYRPFPPSQLNSESMLRIMRSRQEIIDDTISLGVFFQTLTAFFDDKNSFFLSGTAAALIKSADKSSEKGTSADPSTSMSADRKMSPHCASPSELLTFIKYTMERTADATVYSHVSECQSNGSNDHDESGDTQETSGATSRACHAVMCQWSLRTTTAVRCGAVAEIVKAGMLHAHFDDEYRISRLFISFDAMSFSQQVRRVTPGAMYSGVRKMRKKKGRVASSSLLPLASSKKKRLHDTKGFQDKTSGSLLALAESAVLRANFIQDADHAAPAPSTSTKAKARGASMDEKSRRKANNKRWPSGPPPDRTTRSMRAKVSATPAHPQGTDSGSRSVCANAHESSMGYTREETRLCGSKSRSLSRGSSTSPSDLSSESSASPISGRSDAEKMSGDMHKMLRLTFSGIYEYEMEAIRDDHFVDGTLEFYPEVPKVITSAKSPFDIVAVNPAWERLCGHSGKEVINNGTSCSILRNLSDVISDQERRNQKILSSCLRAGQSGTVLLNNYKKDGRRFKNFLCIFPLFSQPTKDGQGRGRQQQHEQVPSFPDYFLGILREVVEKERSND